MIKGVGVGGVSGSGITSLAGHEDSCEVCQVSLGRRKTHVGSGTISAHEAASDSVCGEFEVIGCVYLGSDSSLSSVAEYVEILKAKANTR
jgi:hypothetical protein